MAERPRPERFILGEAVLDMAQGTLTRRGEVVHLRAKSFSLLCELARQPGRVAPKAELLDAVWPDVIVTEDSLTQAVRDIRKAIGDEAGRILRTVPRRGFMLCPTEAAAPFADRAPETSRAGDRPRVALLPLVNRSGDLELGPVLEGFVEEVTVGLALFRNLTVVARHSAFAAAGADLAEIAGRLRADYVVDGSARRGDGGLTLALALSDMATGAVVWGESFVCEGDAWLSLQDVVPRRVAQRLFSSVEDAARRSSLSRRPEALSAFEHLARGRAVFRSYEPDANRRALEHFAKALDADPAYGIAHSYHALARLALHGYEFAPSEVKRASLADAARGVELSADESRCHGIAAAVHALAGEFGPAEEAARRAVRLNPCDAEALYDMAYALLVRGRTAECLSWLARAKELNPLWPPHYDETEAYALFDLRRYEEAAATFQKLPRLRAWHEMQLAACYAYLDRREFVRLHVSRARDLDPGLEVAAKLQRDAACEDAAIAARLAHGVELALSMAAACAGD